jgi:hypothetical protein
VFTLIFGKRFWRSMWGRNLVTAGGDDGTYSSVEFYERLVNALEQRGMSRDKHLTPLEFAQKLDSTLDSGQALMITRAYNRVRFGRQRLTATEKRDIEKALFELESINNNG